MKKNKLLKVELIVLGILCVISFIACNKKIKSSKENVSSNFVVTEINPIVTSVPTEEDQEGDNSEGDKNEGDLYTLSAVPEIEQNANNNNDLPADAEGGDEGSEEVDEIQVFLDSIGSVATPLSRETVDVTVVDSVKAMPAASLVKFNTVNAATLAACFYQEDISQAVYLRMENKSYSEMSTTPIDNLQYVRVLHFGFDGEIYIGELVVNRLIAKDIVEIFKELFDAGYKIERMVLIDDYDADDVLSMEANNTSSFNYRVVDGTTKLSNHAYGLAIDINPLYNPYVRTIDGVEVIQPENSVEYADRTLENSYYIQKGDVCYEAFTKRGFTWGGDWETSKDYQHFQKVFD